MIQITTVIFKVSDPTGSHGLRLGSTQLLNSIMVYRLLWWLPLDPFLTYHYLGWLPLP